MGTQNWLSLEMQGEGLALVTMAQAPVNAMDAKTLDDLAQLFIDLAENSDVKAVVLASGLKVFSAGLDLKQAQHYDTDQQNQIVRGLDIAFGKMFSFPKPLIAAVAGPAIAGGFPQYCVRIIGWPARKRVLDWPRCRWVLDCPLVRLKSHAQCFRRMICDGFCKVEIQCWQRRRLSPGLLMKW